TVCVVGKMRDLILQLSKSSIYSTKPRCSGNGFSVVPSATVHRAILKRLPDLHQSSWSRNWKPFYEGLVDMLHKGERQAAAEFEKATIY
uniref:antitermination protein Q n=1 Tax=Vibrio diabolicus TaxID=50719 RepID=UPI002494DDB2